jgi:hypothetical protein
MLTILICYHTQICILAVTAALNHPIHTRCGLKRCEKSLLLSAGARGGRAEFSWDNVKGDKDREFYLGHSVKAGVGRWQKGARC